MMLLLHVLCVPSLLTLPKKRARTPATADLFFYTPRRRNTHTPITALRMSAQPCWQQQPGRKRATASSGDDELKACELSLVEHQAEALQTIMDETAAANKSLLRVFVIVRAFLARRRRVCYGGTAINNILPKKEQFYGEGDIPDYDAFSDAAVQDAKDMVDTLIAAGVDNVEAKAGVHAGTYKVYAKFIAVLDLTEMPPDVFHCLQATAVADAKDGLLYCHPMYLRVGVHVELGRPMGDVSRWSKVEQRLALLDAAYPLDDAAAFQRLDASIREAGARWPMPPVVFFAGAATTHATPSSSSSSSVMPTYSPESVNAQVAAAVNIVVEHGGVFSGGVACAIYHEFDARQHPNKKIHAALPPPMSPTCGGCVVDVMVTDLATCGGRIAVALGCATNAKRCAADIAAVIHASNDEAAATVVGAVNETTGCRVVLYPPILDLVSWRLECVTADGRRLLVAYESGDSCQAYNEVEVVVAATTSPPWLTELFAAAAAPPEKKRKKKTILKKRLLVRLANLDTSVALLGRIAFIPHMKRPDALGAVCALLQLFARHPLEQTAPWARFKLPCIGDQHGLADIRQEKVAMHAVFKKKGIIEGPEYDRWFLKYAPQENNAAAAAITNKRSRTGAGTKRRPPSSSLSSSSVPATTTTRRRRRRRRRRSLAADELMSSALRKIF